MWCAAMDEWPTIDDVRRGSPPQNARERGRKGPSCSLSHAGYVCFAWTLVAATYEQILPQLLSQTERFAWLPVHAEPQEPLATGATHMGWDRQQIAIWLSGARDLVQLTRLLCSGCGRNYSSSFEPVNKAKSLFGHCGGDCLFLFPSIA